MPRVVTSTLRPFGTLARYLGVVRDERGLYCRCLDQLLDQFVCQAASSGGVGYRAVRDTVPCGIPCRVGYRAVWDTTPGRSAKLKTVRRTACDQTSRAAHATRPQRAQSRERCGARRFVLTAAMAAMLHFEAMAESVRAPSVRPYYPRSDSPFANTVISLGFSHYGRAWG